MTRPGRIDFLVDAILRDERDRYHPPRTLRPIWSMRQLARRFCLIHQRRDRCYTRHARPYGDRKETTP